MAGGEELLRELVDLLGNGDDRVVCKLVCSRLSHGERNDEKQGHSCGMHSETHTLRFPGLFPSVCTVMFDYCNN